jgi:hypothetical protein
LSTVILIVSETPTWAMLTVVTVMGLTLVWMWRCPE